MREGDREYVVKRGSEPVHGVWVDHWDVVLNEVTLTTVRSHIAKCHTEADALRVVKALNEAEGL